MKLLKHRKVDELKNFITNMAKEFNRSKSTISELETKEGTISQIWRGLKLSRDVLIYRLSLLGRAQEEIGKTFNLDQSVVARIMQKFGSEQFFPRALLRDIKLERNIRFYRTISFQKRNFIHIALKLFVGSLYRTRIEKLYIVVE